MKKVRILHIASFTGNIGDNASHNGLYHLLKNYLKLDINITTLEMRKAYLNYKEKDHWSWDKKLINKINSFDLTIIGGGNFFAPWIEDSSSGTTINLPLNLIDFIKKPVMFHSIGFDPYINKYTDNTIDKFSNFINKLTNNPNLIVAVRNDGSKKHLDKLVKKEISSKINQIPDTGFFIKLKNKVIEEFLKDKYIAINLAKDMINNRFSSKFSYNNYLKELAKWLKWMENKYLDFKFVFVPHIYSDIEAINDLLKLLPDMFKRTKIIISPYLQNKNSENLFYIYKNAQFTIGNRFHTNVCSIGLSTPTIALVTYIKLNDLYKELNLKERVIIAKELIKLTISTLENRNNISSKYIDICKELEIDAKLFLNKLATLLNKKS